MAELPLELGRHAGRILLGAVAFYVGIMVGAVAAGAAGIVTPALPEGVDSATLGLYLLASAFMVPLVLAPLSRRLAVGFTARWLILALLVWVTLGLNTALEAVLFSPEQAALIFSAITYGAAALASGAVVAWLYPFPGRTAPLAERLGAFLAGREAAGWTWRALAAVAAFPVIYVAFGMAVRPVIEPYYQSGALGLRVPGWGELLPMLTLRSVLFLVACLPIFVAWRGSSLRLFVVLGTALFMLVGGIYMLQSYWLPPTLRIAHAAEILADSFVYGGALILLLRARPGPGVVAGDAPARRRWSALSS